jgi:hypothetical protein
LCGSSAHRVKGRPPIPALSLDLRAFHDALLESGPLALDVPEAKMRTRAPRKAVADRN